MSSANETIYIETGEGENEPCWCLECGWDGVENDLTFTNDGIFVCPHCGGEEVDDFYSEDVNSCVFCGSDQVVGTIDIVSLNEMNEASPLDKEQVYGYCARCADVKMAEGSTGDQVVSWEDVAGVSSPSMPPSDIKWAESKKERIASGKPMHYAIPSEKKYPIWDKAHARLALAWSKGTQYADKVDSAVSKRFPTMNAETVYRNYQGRKSPALSATSVKRGTRKRGNDGNMWEVRRSGKSQRWFKGAEEGFNTHIYSEEFIDGMTWDEWMDDLDYGQQDAREYFLASRLNDETGSPPLTVDFTTHNGVPADFFIPKLRGIPLPDDDPIWKPYTPSKQVVSETRRCTTPCPNCSGEVEGRVFGEDDLRMKCSDCGWSTEASADDWEWPEEWGEVVKEAESFEAAQGYNDKMDESLGERNVTSGEQSLKDRRDEAAAMDKKQTALACSSCGDKNLNEYADPNAKDMCVFCTDKHRKYDDVSTMDAENMGLTQYVGSAGGSGDGTPVSYGGIAIPESDVTAMVESSTDNPMGASIGTVMGTMGAEKQDMMCCGESMEFYEAVDGNPAYFYCPVCEVSIITKEFDAEEVPVVPDPSSFPQGDGRVLGQQTNQANLSPLHAENKYGDECGCPGGSEHCLTESDDWWDCDQPIHGGKGWSGRCGECPECIHNNFSALGAEGDVQMVKIQDPVITGAKMALGVVALNATAIAGAALIGLAIAHTARREV